LANRKTVGRVDMAAMAAKLAARRKFLITAYPPMEWLVERRKIGFRCGEG
jgi:hypothetical protein